MPLTLVRAVGHWARSIGTCLARYLAGSLLAIGSYFSVRVTESVLRLTLAATLILVAGRLVQ